MSLDQLKMVSFKDTITLSKIFAGFSQEMDITIWQNTRNEMRICSEARMGLLNLVQSEITFHPSKGDFQFKEGEYLYFWNKMKNTIFKAKIKYQLRNKVVIGLPEEVLMPNLRTENRVNMENKEFLLNYRLNSKSKQTHLGFYMTSRLIDISKTGLSFKTTINNISSYKKDETLWLQSPINGDLVEGRITYVSILNEIKIYQNYLRIGVKII